MWKIPRFFHNRRLLFLAILVLSILGSGQITRVWASTYVGVPSSQGIACPNPGCIEAAASTDGIGGVGQAPFTSTVQSISFFAAGNAPTSVAIADFGTVQPTTDPCFAFGTCIKGSQSFTLRDFEGLSGITTGAFNTVTLANPPTVAVNDWVSVTVLGASCGNGCISTCSTSTGIGCGVSLFFTLQIAFGSTNPTIGNTFSTIDAQTAGINPGVSGLTFAPVGSTTSVQTVCYGNCGTPPITLVNTNSTHLFAFNQSITLLYEFQSNGNGFLLNVTASVAKSNPNNGITFSTYTIANGCPANLTPFTPQCPGFLTGGFNQQPVIKGKLSTVYGNAAVSVTNGEWIAIGVSCTFGPCDLNDTNTNVGLFQANGFGAVPASTLTAVQGQGNSKLGLWAWITTNVVTGGGPGTTTSACQNNFAQIDCLLPALVNLFCSAQTTSCTTASALIFVPILAIIILAVLLSLFSSMMPSVHVSFEAAGDVFMLLMLVMIFVMTSLGLLPPFVPILIFLVVAIIFGKQLGGHLG